MILAQTDPMRFVVRYWSSLLPAAGIGPDTPHWIDYSVHPATRLGLHNALLVVHDRLDILGAHGGKFECAVFVVDGERCERLLPEVAEALFPHLAPGEVKWIDIHEFHLPEVPSFMRIASSAGVPSSSTVSEPRRPSQYRRKRIRLRTNSYRYFRTSIRPTTTSKARRIRWT